MRILGIETSCDETAAAIVEGLGVRGQGLESCVLSTVVASQIKIHAKTGGVVPEVAARAHVEKIIPVVQQALLEAKSKERRAKSSKPYALCPMHYAASVDVIAVTAGPGLATSLLVGVEVARTLSWLWKKPLIAVNHLAGHVYANFLSEKIRSKEQIAKSKSKQSLRSTPYVLRFPALALIVSGGHTELVLMRKHLDFKIVGETRDDAAGEAFDKVAKMLGLGYPGGPAISAMAEKCKVENVKCKMIDFPRPMIDSPDFDFSFSGLKTAVLYWLRAQSAEHRVKPYALSPKLLASVCHEFQEAVVDVLVTKAIRAAKKYKVKTVLLGGGVAANARLRQRLVEAIKCQLHTTSYVLPSFQYTTDNAAMIAAAGYFMARAKQFTPWQKLDVDPNWELGQKFRPRAR